MYHKGNNIKENHAYLQTITKLGMLFIILWFWSFSISRSNYASFFYPAHVRLAPGPLRLGDPASALSHPSALVQRLTQKQEQEEAPGEQWYKTSLGQSLLVGKHSLISKNCWYSIFFHLQNRCSRWLAPLLQTKFIIKAPTTEHSISQIPRVATATVAPCCNPESMIGRIATPS